MARRRDKNYLISRVTNALREAGCALIYFSEPSDHPACFGVARGERHVRLRIYIWNLTHGGGSARPADEFRIQITGIEEFTQEPLETTLLLGWSEEYEIFAAFDFRRHQGELGASPSIQIREGAIDLASANGMAPWKKASGEIAVAVRPDSLADYVFATREFHESGESPPDLEVLTKISEDPEKAEDSDLAEASADRREFLASFRRLRRDARFRKKILDAYAHRCAVCGLQLDLLEAAHIVPVSYPGSTDEISNGIALCPLHHAAFDRCLISISDNYQILINEEEAGRLEATDRKTGLDDFRGMEGKQITLPAKERDRPNAESLHIARSARGWPDQKRDD